MERQLDLSDISYVHRIAIGTSDPEKPTTEAEAQLALAKLNRCLSETPRGKLIGIERPLCQLNVGEHRVVLQALIYHVGFPRRPHWLTEESADK